MLSTPSRERRTSVWRRFVALAAVTKIHEVWTKPFAPVLFFFGGVTYDTLTLTRIDRLLDNLILLLYLSLLGASIIVTGRAQLGLLPSCEPTPHRAGPVLALIHRVRPHMPKALQFLFGGLFSAYAVYYSQSASLTTTAVFLGCIVVLLVVNEFLHDRVFSLKLVLALFAVVTMSFFTFFLPIVLGRMGAWVFLLGAGLSALVLWRIVALVYRGASRTSKWEPWQTGAPAFIAIAMIIGFYFLNWIPPVPLSLKFAGMYHHVQRVDDTYRLTFSKGQWYEIWKRSDDRFARDEPAYCFTAVFAPVDLETTIYHHWAYRPSNRSGAFVTTDRIPLRITGGRARGYRGYTVKRRLDPGEWRVDVETHDGRVIGRLTFDVDARSTAEPAWITSVY